MQVNKEDIEGLNATFKIIDKSVFKELDANGVIAIYQDLIKGKKLLAKMQAEVNSAPVAEDKQPTEVKKGIKLGKGGKGKK